MQGSALPKSVQQALGIRVYGRLTDDVDPHQILQEGNGQASEGPERAKESASPPLGERGYGREVCAKYISIGAFRGSAATSLLYCCVAGSPT